MKAPRKAANRLGLGCLTLFALPFAGFGLFAILQAFREIHAGKWQAGVPLLLFGFVFCAVGFGLMAFGVLGGKKAKQQKAIEAGHPDEPWLWREDWARGEVKSAGRAGLVFISAFALLWNVISGAVFFGILSQPNHGQAIYIVLIFPLAGVLLLVWALRQWLHWRRFGESVFRLTTVPGVIGGPLAGVIRTAARLQRVSEIRLHLVCVESDSSGDSTSERVEWEDEKILTGEILQSGEGIPVVFNIPFDCQPIATLSASRSILWRLDVRATMPGTDYAAQFEVPVFKTAESRADSPKLPDPSAAYEKPIDLALPRGVRIRTAATGGTEFHFAAARNKSAALGLTLFTAFWIGAIVLMVKFKAPIGFPIVFGFFGVLMVLGILVMWTGASKVVADMSGLHVTHWFCFFSWKKFVPAVEVQSIQPKLGMSSNSVTYYDLLALTNGGKKVKLATAIKGRKESEWFAREIQNALVRK